MSASPQLKVFNPEGHYIAACKHGEDAAALMALNGEGSKVKLGHSSVVLWHEGHETQPAAESYDFVTETVAARIAAHWKSSPCYSGHRNEV